MSGTYEEGRNGQDDDAPAHMRQAKKEIREGEHAPEEVDTPASQANGSPADVVAGEPEELGVLSELVAGNGTDEAGDEGGVLGGTEVGGMPAEGGRGRNR